MMIHLRSLVLHQSYPVFNHSPMKNKNKYRIDMIELKVELN